VTTPGPPPGWYPDPNDASRQRYWDGSKWTSLPPPPSDAAPRAKSRLGPLKVLAIIAASIIALIGGCSACVAMIAGNGGNSSSTTSTSTTESVPRYTTPTSEAAPPPPGLNQEARDGKFGFTVLSVERVASVTDRFETKTAQGLYAVVSIKITNTGTRPQSFFATNQKLKDNKGREFEAGFGTFTGEFHDGDDINPGNQVYAKMAFDIPPDAQPAQIVLHDSAFSFGVTVNLI
jgi:hypothetical protein